MDNSFIAIIIGASEFTAERYKSDKGFSEAHKSFKSYATIALKIRWTKPRKKRSIQNTFSGLDLFDSELTVNEQDKLIIEFLDSQSGELTLVLYYIGHGDIEHGDFILPVKSTQKNSLYQSSFVAKVLANHLKRTSQRVRCFAFIDACFAGEIGEIIAQSPGPGLLIDFFLPGIACLCSSPRDKESYVLPDHSNTAFTDGVIGALTMQKLDDPAFLSLRDIQLKTSERIHDRKAQFGTNDQISMRFNPPVPQVYSRDREGGNLATHQVFPLRSKFGRKQVKPPIKPIEISASSADPGLRDSEIDSLKGRNTLTLESTSLPNFQGNRIEPQAGDENIQVHLQTDPNNSWDPISELENFKITKPDGVETAPLPTNVIPQIPEVALDAVSNMEVGPLATLLSPYTINTDSVQPEIDHPHLDSVTKEISVLGSELGEDPREIVNRWLDKRDPRAHFIQEVQENPEHKLNYSEVTTWLRYQHYLLVTTETDQKRRYRELRSKITRTTNVSRASFSNLAKLRIEAGQAAAARIKLDVMLIKTTGMVISDYRSYLSMNSVRWSFQKWFENELDQERKKIRDAAKFNSQMFTLWNPVTCFLFAIFAWYTWCVLYYIRWTLESWPYNRPLGTSTINLWLSKIQTLLVCGLPFVGCVVVLYFALQQISRSFREDKWTKRQREAPSTARAAHRVIDIVSLGTTVVIGTALPGYLGYITSKDLWNVCWNNRLVKVPLSFFSIGIWVLANISLLLCLTWVAVLSWTYLASRKRNPYRTDQYKELDEGR